MRVDSVAVVLVPIGNIDISTIQLKLICFVVIVSNSVVRVLLCCRGMIRKEFGGR